ncbi:alpha-tocopherol transfer protein-like [Solenopsis invicta]|uniref:alpha-tocopherol transfer protein-like n=1 Tax=Solenopsis invicta TaxID=13686 RepID=UPI0005960F21|nr:alpha-tocopherol transfer protein-like [Solenopsis invicta]XP_011163331.1 alpha-tocopherol transfer protein-like [Solenopsis invicta]
MSLIKRISYDEEKKKNPELKDSDIQILKDWCTKQQHLPKISDAEYVLFLHSNYYRIEPAKNTIEEYYTTRTHMPEFFSDRDPLGTKSLREAFQTTAQITLSMPTKEGYKIIYSKLIDYEASHFVYNDVMKYFSMMVDMWLYTEGTAEGHIIVIDMINVSFAHAGRLNPLGIKRYLYYLQEAIPIRLKGLHFVNTNAVMDIILAMMKPFMKKELMDVLHIHTTKDTLAKFIPLEAFPCDVNLDGKSKPLKEQQEQQLKKLQDHREWFLQDEVMGRVNEALRIGKSKTIDMFGVEGSFKKLDID